MKNEKIIIWLPDGYGVGTIIYDYDSNPYEATEYVKGVGLNMYNIEKVDKDYAEKRIKQGANKLISTKKD